HEIAVTPPRQSGEGSRQVTLFFAAEGTRLARETRNIDPCEDDNACLESVLDELLNGPVGELGETLPEGTTVDAVRMEDNQATIEFNRTFSDEMLSGSSAEMLAVYSVVDTVAANFPQIQKVKINVDGNKEVVLRHLDLSDPLVPDYSLEQSPSPEPEKSTDGSNANRKGVPR
ncbi:MAG: GerMN domain-containing protein, partial [Desulfuromonadaceae bacterium]